MELQAPEDLSLVNTGCSIRDLLEAAMTDAQGRDELVGDDCEGATLSSRPSSPLSDLTESEDGSPPPLSPSTSTQHSPPTIEKQRKKIAAARRRKARRAKAATPNSAHDYRLKPSHVQKYRERAAQSIKFNLKSLAASAAAGAWVGKRATGSRMSQWTLDELLGRGFRIIEWDGM